MRNLMESFKDNLLKELPIELDQNYPTHIPVEKMIEIVFEASKKANMDSYSVLKDFEFTDEEIRDYFEKLEKRTEI